MLDDSTFLYVPKPVNEVSGTFIKTNIHVPINTFNTT